MTSGRTVGRVRAGTDGRDKEDGDRAKEGGERQRQRKRGRATGRGGGKRGSGNSDIIIKGTLEKHDEGEGGQKRAKIT